MKNNLMFMGINWKLRFQSEEWWLLAIPTVVVAVANILDVFGVSVPADAIVNSGNQIITSIFAIGVLFVGSVDMTTEGLADSKRAKNYVQPYDDTKYE